MSIIIYAESENGKIRKSAYELASYGRAIADKMNFELIAVAFNLEEEETLGKYGVEKVIKFNGQSMSNFTAAQYADNISSVAKEYKAKILGCNETYDKLFLNT